MAPQGASDRAAAQRLLVGIAPAARLTQPLAIDRSCGGAHFRGRDPVGEVCASGHNSGVETLRAEHAADVEEMSGARISLLRSDRPGPLCSCARCGGERSQARKRHRSGQAARHASAAQLLACRTPAACLQAVHAKHAGHPCASPRTRARAREAWREAGRAHADPHQVAARALSKAGQPPRTSTGHRVWSAVARRKPRAR